MSVPSKANPAPMVCQYTVEALMSSDPASGFTKREGDPDKGEQVRHYCTNCWRQVLEHESAMDIQARYSAEHLAVMIDPAKRAYNAAKRDMELMMVDRTAIIQRLEEHVRKGNMSPSQLVWLSPFVVGGLEAKEGQYLLSAMATTIATGSDEPMVKAHNVIYAQRRKLDHKAAQFMNSRLPIMPTNTFCPDIDQLVLAAAQPFSTTDGHATRWGSYQLPRRFPDRYGGDMSVVDVILPVCQHQSRTHVVQSKTPLETMFTELRQTIIQLIERVRAIEVQYDGINYDALGSLISDKLRTTRSNRNRTSNSYWQLRHTPPSRNRRGGQGRGGTGIFTGATQQREQQLTNKAIFRQQSSTTRSVNRAARGLSKNKHVNKIIKDEESRTLLMTHSLHRYGHRGLLRNKGSSIDTNKVDDAMLIAKAAKGRKRNNKTGEEVRQKKRRPKVQLEHGEISKLRNDIRNKETKNGEAREMKAASRNSNGSILKTMNGGADEVAVKKKKRSNAVTLVRSTMGDLFVNCPREEVVSKDIRAGETEYGDAREMKAARRHSNGSILKTMNGDANGVAEWQKKRRSTATSVRSTIGHLAPNCPRKEVARTDSSVRGTKGPEQRGGDDMKGKLTHARETKDEATTRLKLKSIAKTRNGDAAESECLSMRSTTGDITVMKRISVDETITIDADTYDTGNVKRRQYVLKTKNGDTETSEVQVGEIDEEKTVQHGTLMTKNTRVTVSLNSSMLDFLPDGVLALKLRTRVFDSATSQVVQHGMLRYAERPGLPRLTFVSVSQGSFNQRVCASLRSVGDSPFGGDPPLTPSELSPLECFRSVDCLRINGVAPLETVTNHPPHLPVAKCQTVVPMSRTSFDGMATKCRDRVRSFCKEDKLWRDDTTTYEATSSDTLPPASTLRPKHVQRSMEVKHTVPVSHDQRQLLRHMLCSTFLAHDDESVPTRDRMLLHTESLNEVLQHLPWQHRVRSTNRRQARATAMTCKGCISFSFAGWYQQLVVVEAVVWHGRRCHYLRRSAAASWSADLTTDAHVMLLVDKTPVNADVSVRVCNVPFAFSPYVDVAWTVGKRCKMGEDKLTDIDIPMGETLDGDFQNLLKVPLCLAIGVKDIARHDEPKPEAVARDSDTLRDGGRHQYGSNHIQFVHKDYSLSMPNNDRLSRLAPCSAVYELGRDSLAAPYSRFRSARLAAPDARKRVRRSREHADACRRGYAFGSVGDGRSAPSSVYRVYPPI